MRSLVRAFFTGASLILLAALASISNARGEEGASCKSSPTPKDARVSIGKQLCETNVDSGDANDPCHMAKLYKTGVQYETINAYAYAFDALACSSACFVLSGMGDKPCVALTVATVGVEGIQTYQLFSDGNETVGKILAGDLAKDLAGLGAYAALPGGKSEAASKKNDTSASCKLALVNAGQSLVRYMDLQNIEDKMDEAYEQKWCMATNGMINGKLEGGDIASNGSSGDRSGGQFGGELKTMRGGGLSPEQAQARVEDTFANLTPEQQKFFSQASETTGISPRRAMMDTLTGKAKSPFAAMAGQLSGKLDDKQKKALKDIDNGAGKLATLARKDLNSLPKTKMDTAKVQFASSAGNTAPAQKEENPLAGFGDMLSQLMPKKDQKEPSSGVSNVEFGAAGHSRSLASQRMLATSEGLHTPDDSLFDVVGTRYHSVMLRFLNGETLVAPPAKSGNLPDNPYLAH